LDAVVQVIGTAQFATGEQLLQVDGSGNWVRYLPVVHCEQFELVAVVQVSATLQPVTSVHCWHESTGPSWSQYPTSHVVHWLSDGVEHSSAEMQLLIVVHSWQTSACPLPST
jgi:hypothetical protein